MNDNNKSLKTHGHEFLQDVNYDFDQKTLAGFGILMVAIILSVVCVIYGLSHEIASHSIISTIIIGLYSLSGSLLGLTMLTKEKKEECPEMEAKPHNE